MEMWSERRGHQERVQATKSKLDPLLEDTETQRGTLTWCAQIV